MRGFLSRHGALPEQIRGREALRELISDMEEGLCGRGNIPMLLSYLPPRTDPPAGGSCAVLDAGGTTLRIGRASFGEDGAVELADIRRMPMPGSRQRIGCDAFFSSLAEALGRPERVGFCFSYNVEMDRDLDGRLLAWCKEIDIPDAVGKKVGGSLAAAMDRPCRVHVLNDSVAAMLGAAEPVRVGIILGTGVNVCYPEDCGRIPKLERPLKGSMIVSTEVGEFARIPRSSFDEAVIAATEDPALAQAEKQCSGGYLGDTVCACWHQAAEEGLLPGCFLEGRWSLAQISGYLAGEDTPIPENETAKALAAVLICRAAKIAAVLCAGPVLRCSEPGETVPVAVEGSQYWRLTGFRQAFHEAIRELLPDRELRVVRTEDACLRGAALAAFAEPMELL